MTNLKLPSMTHENLLKLTEKTGEDWKKIAYQTWARRDPGSPSSIVAIRHHSSTIAYVQPGKVILNSRGHNTRTTSHRMNAILYANTGQRVGMKQGLIHVFHQNGDYFLEGECHIYREV
ncbi:gp091 [Rhodococcus phage ReqiDocB7]|uniref:gp091 n=1 Tax=Rhodococcus phage ReqiDocB7 TaxID=691966 RepID=UPI0001CDD874|nr:gp091 [Rhodococcus phage ReqiDocB7]ADD80877.1 gp091 [Rhodococcus phage ReqiDocB7]